MANFQIRAKSISQARKLFDSIGRNAWNIRTRTNRISPHITVTFTSDLNLSDLRKVIAEQGDDPMMKSTLHQDLREVLLV
ncbi:MAG: hypothetical protein AAGC47_13445 [Bacteroidota bacterium]